MIGFSLAAAHALIDSMLVTKTATISLFAESHGDDILSTDLSYSGYTNSSLRHPTIAAYQT